jgi:hypothetical protein
MQHFVQCIVRHLDTLGCYRVMKDQSTSSHATEHMNIASTVLLQYFK